jgi:hypothetical protein
LNLLFLFLTSTILWKRNKETTFEPNIH